MIILKVLPLEKELLQHWKKKYCLYRCLIFFGQENSGLWALQPQGGAVGQARYSDVLVGWHRTQVSLKIQPLNFKYEWHQVFVHWHNYLFKDVSYLWQLLLSSSIEMKIINFHEVFIYRLGKPTKSKHCHADLRIRLQPPSSPAQHWEESVWGRICCGRHLSSPKAAHNHPLRAKVI